MTTLAVIGMNLRVDDNPALFHAVEGADQADPRVVAVVCEDTNQRSPGAAFRWWTALSLSRLRAELDELGIPLVAVRAPLNLLISDLVNRLGVTDVHANRRWGETALEIDRSWAQELRDLGINVHGHTAHTLHDPWDLRTGQGGPYRVFTPFAKRFEQLSVETVGVPGAHTRDAALFRAVSDLEVGEPLENHDEPSWTKKFPWVPGEQAAMERLEDFLAGPVEDYSSARDLPGVHGTSTLSPHLAHGEISPRRAWEMTQQRAMASPSESVASFQSELLWREFNHHLLYHYPDMHAVNLNPRFDAFPWKSPEEATVAEQVAQWKSGHTGHPIVDAGMRELWETGWMHNRVRMVVASLLTKNIGVHWSVGERWFWDTLVDADPGSNPGNWQWASGTGADAAPYFRIFNPRRQAERFDADAAYVHRWVPELRDVPAASVMKLYDSDAALPPTTDTRPIEHRVAETWEVYPAPVVDLKSSREEALAAYQATK